MGDRALVIFHDETEVSPTVYLHWGGNSVVGQIEELAKLMHNRKGDAPYACARFIGLSHVDNPGNLSLGVSSNDFSLDCLKDSEKMSEISHGDAGVVVVNCAEFTWSAFGGYLADRKQSDPDSVDD